MGLSTLNDGPELSAAQEAALRLYQRAYLNLRSGRQSREVGAAADQIRRAREVISREQLAVIDLVVRGRNIAWIATNAELPAPRVQRLLTETLDVLSAHFALVRQDRGL